MRMLLLLVLVLLSLSDCSEDLPEKKEQLFSVTTNTKNNAERGKLTPEHPINGAIQHSDQLNHNELVNMPYRQRLVGRKSKRGRLRRRCQLKNSKKVRRCFRFSKPKKERKSSKFSLSIPI